MLTEEQIRQLVAENERLRAANESLAGRLEKSESKVQEQACEIADLKYQMGLLRQKLYGRKSEKHLSLDPDVLQGNLFSDIELPEDERKALDAEIAAMEARNAKAIAPKAPRHRGAGKPMFSALDVEETHIYPDYPEGSDADDYVEIGTEQTDTIAVRPAKMYIKRVIRHKMVLRSSLQIQDPDRQAFLIAPLPPQTLARSMADESILADIIINKYLYHLPFHRQIEKYKELGVILSSSTVGDWFEAVCDRLRPLYDRLREEIMKTDYIQVDESNVPVIDNEKRKAVKGYMWVVRDMSRGMSYFHYDGGSRSAEVARRLIGGYRGAVQTDGYEVYGKYENDDRKLMLGCWAHARRRFAEALNYDRRHASEALVYIGRLYDIEREMKEAGLPPEVIRDRRLKEAVPVMDRFETWLEVTSMKFGTKDPMGKAIMYAYAFLPRLRRYVFDGRYRIDNNTIESSIRPLAVGRKNYMFCGNDAAAIRAAICYSLISCCKSADVSPRQWLEDILPRISQEKDLTKLLPMNWKKERENTAVWDIEQQ